MQTCGLAIRDRERLDQFAQRGGARRPVCRRQEEWHGRRCRELGNAARLLPKHLRHPATLKL